MPNAVLLPRQVRKHISTVDVEQRTIENRRNLVDEKRGAHLASSLPAPTIELECCPELTPRLSVFRKSN